MITRVALADDTPLIREGFQRLLETESDLSVVGCAKDAHELLELLSRDSCDVVVLDIHMPGPGFLEALSRILGSPSKPRVLVLTGSSEELFALRALQNGASGYLTKDAEPDDIIMAIRKIARGHRYITPHVAELLVESMTSDPDRPRHHDLSDREFDVLRLLGAGQSTNEVASTLSISPKTVATYRARIYEKLGIKGMSELIRYALEHQLTEQ
ncbi:MAG: response regulator [Longimicrobiales bacterium]